MSKFVIPPLQVRYTSVSKPFPVRSASAPIIGEKWDLHRTHEMRYRNSFMNLKACQLLLTKK